MNVPRALRWLLIPTALALALALLLSVWLVRSDGGRDWLLARVVGVLPADATLRWDEVDGTLSGPLEIRGIHFQYQGTSFDARRLRVDHGLWPLLSRRLDIHSLTIEHSLLVLPTAKRLEFPRWPEAMPVLDLPITVSVGKLQVRDLRIRQGGEPLMRFTSIDGSFTVGNGVLRLRKLVGVSDRAWIHLSGDYLPRDNFRTALAGRLVFPTVAGSAPAQATLIAKGNLDDLLLSFEGHAPAPLSVRLRLMDGAGKPHWRFDAGSSRLLVQQLGLPEDLPYAFELHALSEHGNAIVQGRVARGDLSVLITPSRLRLKEGVVTAAPLALTLAQGPIALNGTLELAGKNPRFDLSLRSTALQLSPQANEAGAKRVSANGDLRLHGHWQAWTVEGSANMLRAGQKATVTLAGRGDAHHLSLDRFLAKTPGGSLRGKGELHWDPRLAATMAAELSGFDPGYFFPDYPGALSGKLEASGERDAKGLWKGDARVADLRGSLRKRPVQGQASVHILDGAGSGDLSLRIGNSHIEAGGRYGEQLDLQAQFSPLDLSDLVAGATGRLRGRVAARGKRTAPAYEATLQGEDLRWDGLAAGHLSAEGALPANGRGGNLQLSAQRVTLAGERFEQLTLALAGSLASFHAKLGMSGEIGSLEAQATAAGQGQQWQGRLEQLRIAPRRGPGWHLQAESGFRYASGEIHLERACLEPTTPGGRLCAQASGARMTISGHGLPLTLVEPWLPEGELALQPFGDIDFDGEFGRQLGGDWGGQAQLRSASGGLRIDPESPQEVVSYSDLRLDLLLKQTRLSMVLAAKLPEGGSISGRVESALSATAPLDGELRLELRQLDWMELLSTDLAGTRGELIGTLLFSGRLDAPVLSGDARLSGFSAELPSLGVRMSAGDFTLRGESDGEVSINGQVSSGSGQLRVEGSLNLRDRSSPLVLNLRGENITVANTPDLEATMSPDLQLSYADGTLQIRGSVEVPSARVDLERLDNSVSPSPDVVVLDPRRAASKSVLLVDTDVELRLGKAVRLLGFGLKGKLGGSLQIRDRPGRAVQANGTLEVAGTYTVYGRALTITRGRLNYVNAAYDNPVLDILAEREFQDATALQSVTVGIRVRGNAQAPIISVSSSPGMATTEAVSWLSLGHPLSTATGSEAQRVSTSAMALNAGSSILAQKLGARLGLDSAGVSENRALGGSTFMVGKQISPRLFVGYGLSMVGTGQVVTLKYLMAYGLNLSLETSSVESAGSLNWRKEK